MLKIACGAQCADRPRAVLVNPYDVENIAHGIEQLVEDSALRSKLISAGLAQAWKFSWEETAARTRNVLIEVLKGNT